MPTDLTVIEAAQNLPAALGPDLTAAVDLAKAEKAPSTRKAYRADFRLFQCVMPSAPLSSSLASSALPRPATIS